MASRYDDFEVVVVDDGSVDDSVAIIRRYPCRLLLLPVQRGASAARNAGAAVAKGEYLLFIDADCLVLPNTLAVAGMVARQFGPDWIVGGTYTPRPPPPDDTRFFSLFQSVFIHHFESKRFIDPDYVASHAMVIAAVSFRQSGGFPSDFLPIIEDVEFSHRLRRQGYKMRMAAQMLVRHVFNYNLRRSLANARRKSRYWTLYSLKNRDLLSDSGVASHELKINVAAFALTVILLILLITAWLGPILLPGVVDQVVEEASLPGTVIGSGLTLIFGLQLLNGLVQSKLLLAFYRAGGCFFTMRAGVYYAFIYPLPVGLGGLGGLWTYLWQRTTDAAKNP